MYRFISTKMYASISAQVNKNPDKEAHILLSKIEPWVKSVESKILIHQTHVLLYINIQVLIKYFFRDFNKLN